MDLKNLVMDVNFINVELTDIYDDCDGGVNPEALMSRIDDLFRFTHKLEMCLRKCYIDGEVLK